ncbi:MAG: glycosyltransferase [Thermoplasmatales archaeon]
MAYEPGERREYSHGAFKESENVPPLLEALDKAMIGCKHEIIVVDDNSPDGTVEFLLNERASRDGLKVKHNRFIGNNSGLADLERFVDAELSPMVTNMSGGLFLMFSLLPGLKGIAMARGNRIHSL